MLRQNAININFFQRISDIVINILGFFLAYYLRDYLHFFLKELKSIPSPGYYYQLLLFISVLILLLGSVHNLYKSQRIKKISEEIKDVIVVYIEAFTLAFIIFFCSNLWIPSRSFLLVYLVIAASLAIAFRLILRLFLRYIRRQGYNVKHIIIVGTGKEAENFTLQIQQNREWGLNILGYLTLTPKASISKKINKKMVLGSIKKLKQLIVQTTVDEIVFAVDHQNFKYIFHPLLLCEKMGINTKVKMNVFSMKLAHPSLDYMGKIPYITFTSQPEPSLTLLVKNIFDFLLAFAALCFLVPFVFTPIAIILKLTSRGPIFFRQTRVGEGNRLFQIYKFRSMVENAEKLKKGLLSKNEMGKNSIAFKMKNDPRITPLGKFLRKTSLDELPQLINVLKGEMSLVGPRPPVPSEVSRYPDQFWRRIRMKPGITCIWQVSGRNNVDFDEWMKMDMQYIDNWSLWLDLKILLKSIPVVLFRKGAY